MPIWTAVDTDGDVLETAAGLGTTGVIHMTPALQMHSRHLDVFKTTISKQSKPILPTNGSYQARTKYDKPLVIAWHQKTSPTGDTGPGVRAMINVVFSATICFSGFKSEAPLVRSVSTREADLLE